MEVANRKVIASVLYLSYTAFKLFHVFYNVLGICSPKKDTKSAG